MSKEHLMKHCVDLQALLTDKQTGEADKNELGDSVLGDKRLTNRLVNIANSLTANYGRTGCVVCFSKNKRPTIRSTAVNN
jgi:hypothetical protein